MISIYIGFFRLKNSLNRRVIFSKCKKFYRFELVTWLMSRNNYVYYEKIQKNVLKKNVFLENKINKKFYIIFNYILSQSTEQWITLLFKLLPYLFWFRRYQRKTKKLPILRSQFHPLNMQVGSSFFVRVYTLMWTTKRNFFDSGCGSTVS